MKLPEVVLVAQSHCWKQNRFAVNDLNVGCRSVLIILHQTDRQLYHKVDYDGQANKNPEQSETKTIIILKYLNKMHVSNIPSQLVLSRKSQEMRYVTDVVISS